MMQYNDKYFRMMMPFIKKSLKRRYGKEYTKDLVKKTDVVYRDMLSRIDDIGADNPMASNIYSCLVFLALWKAADGRISISDLRKITLEMMHFLVPTYLTYICVEIFSGAVRGAGDVVAPTLMTCFGVCILRVLWILVAVPMHRTVVMVEWSYPITWTLTSVMYVIYYFHGGWLRRCKEKQQNTFRQTEEQE